MIKRGFKGTRIQLGQDDRYRMKWRQGKVYGIFDNSIGCAGDNKNSSKECCILSRRFFLEVPCVDDDVLIARRPFKGNPLRFQK
jgi:hypothetical protein